ncbi:hypothetical protein QBC40DRAFT_270957 [Triangularia verruculosa]|uniref:Uncharacterized protein n=1 Tax=Triangularia verruculosa TaxID=2587418 RepID=A0AAN7B0K8_9PEZI|nr:hypothetical protein QBC40DRAFT_270957 [Triangularia verruculosa]
MADINQTGGGFLPPSPAPTATSTATTAISSASPLPHPRGHALKPGSAKEDKVRHYISDRLAHINRRLVTKSKPDEEFDRDIHPYTSLADLCQTDLDPLINIIWLSGTPNLQIPYLLNIASDFNDWLKTPTSFTTPHKASSAAIFGTLAKLDHCFASLLTGRDFVTSDPLPGFFTASSPTGGSGMSKTDMVRVKSTVQQTRVVIVEALDSDDDDETSRVEEIEDEDDEDDNDGDGWDDREKERLFMDVARVYENTLVKLGELLLE